VVNANNITWQHELIPDISTMQHWNSLQDCCLVKKKKPFARGLHLGEAQAQYLSSQQTHLFECRSLRPRHSEASHA
jgi:hypothetical protein